MAPFLFDLTCILECKSWQNTIAFAAPIVAGPGLLAYKSLIQQKVIHSLLALLLAPLAPWINLLLLLPFGHAGHTTLALVTLLIWSPFAVVQLRQIYRLHKASAHKALDFIHALLSAK
jgi:hypothetical protein